METIKQLKSKDLKILIDTQNKNNLEKQYDNFLDEIKQIDKLDNQIEILKKNNNISQDENNLLENEKKNTKNKNSCKNKNNKNHDNTESLCVSSSILGYSTNRNNKGMKNEFKKDNIYSIMYKKQEKNINALEDKNKKQEKNINALEAQNKRLDNEVKDLKKFLFSAKIRKLLKNLIEFIVNNFFPNHIKYSRTNKKIFFISAPRTLSTLKWAKEQEIVNALNRLLELLFSHSKQQDYVIHFVEPRVTRNNTLKQIFYVFNNPEQFFEYFKISNDDRKILKEIIPHNYFTIIDNLKFEVNVKELINNIAKNYV